MMGATKEEALAAFRWGENQPVLFIALFVIGSVGIVALREFGVSSLLTGAYAITLMIVYALFGVTKKFIIRRELLGDNLYYLGFLFTLTSLAYTLYRYASAEAGQIDRVVQNFGLAIATTLVGLVLRVFFNQPKEDVLVYEEAVRESLTASAADLIGATSKIRADLETLKTSIMQSVSEGVSSSFVTLQAATRDSAEKIDQQLQKAFSNLVDTLEQSGKLALDAAEQREIESKRINDDVKRRIQQEISESDERSSKLNETSRRLVSDLSGLCDQISNLRHIDKAILEKASEPINAFAAQIDRLTGNLSIHVEAAAKLDNATDAVAQHLSVFSTVRLPQYLSALAALKDGAEKAVEMFHKINIQMEKFVDSVRDEGDGVPGRLRQLQNTLDELASGLSESAQQTKANIETLEKSLVAVTRAVVEAVKNDKARR